MFHFVKSGDELLLLLNVAILLFLNFQDSALNLLTQLDLHF